MGRVARRADPDGRAASRRWSISPRASRSWTSWRRSPTARRATPTSRSSRRTRTRRRGSSAARCGASARGCVLEAHGEADDDRLPLHDVARRLAEVVDMAEVLRTLCDIASRQCHATGAAVLRMTGKLGEVVAAVGNVVPARGRCFEFEGSMFEEALDRGDVVARGELQRLGPAAACGSCPSSRSDRCSSRRCARTARRSACWR